MERKENKKSINTIDIEASGLSSTSYPIEVGVALATGETFDRLIRPLNSWTHWDNTAQQIHGINRSTLLRYGKSPREVCLELNHLCRGLTLYSDGWSYDSSWINKLFGAAAITPEFRCSPIEAVIGSTWHAGRWQSVKAKVAKDIALRPHRALADSVIISAAFKIYTGIATETDPTVTPLTTQALVG